MARMDLKSLYCEVGQRLNKIDFELLWTDFKKYKFALYNSKEICLGGKILRMTRNF